MNMATTYFAVEGLCNGALGKINTSFTRHIAEDLCDLQISSDRNDSYVMTNTCERPNPMITGLPL